MSHPIAPGRECGKCSMCCKLLHIIEINKPANKWCWHCKPGRGGCSIYETRPPTCKGYACGWLMSKNVSDDWYPLHSHMVLSLGVHDGINCITVTVDPAHPEMWKQAPYYQQLKNMVRAGLAAKTKEEIQLVHVRCDNRVWLMTADDDIDITYHTYIVKLSGARYSVELYASQAQAQKHVNELTHV